MTRILLFAALVLCPALRAQPQSPLPSAIGILDASAKLATLADMPAPSGLSVADRKKYQDETVWLRSVVVRLDSAAAQVKRAREQATGPSSERVSTILTPDLDLLRKKLEEEALKFSALSAQLKARHDAAMGTIRNIK